MVLNRYMRKRHPDLYQDDLIRAFSGLSIRGTAPLPYNAALLTGELKQQQNFWADVCWYSAMMSGALCKSKAGTYMAKHSWERTQVNPETGDLLYREDSVSVHPIHCSWYEIYNYYKNLHKRIQMSPAMVPLVEESKKKINIQNASLKTTYYTSYTLIPENDLKNEPTYDDMCVLRQVDNVGQLGRDSVPLREGRQFRPLKMSASNMFPVVGCLLDSSGIWEILNTYAQYPYYHTYIQYVLRVLYYIALKKRCLLHRRRGAHFGMERPVIHISKVPKFETVYTGTHAITKHEVEYEANLPFPTNPKWDEIWPNILKPLEKSEHFQDYKRQMITNLQLVITMVTYTCKPIDAPNHDTPFEENILKCTGEETIIGQDITVRGNYVGYGDNILQPRCAIRFSTVNQGHEELHSDVRAIMLKFGYGLPLQLEVHGQGIRSFFGKHFENVPVEKVVLGIDRLASKITSTWYKKKILIDEYVDSKGKYVPATIHITLPNSLMPIIYSSDDGNKTMHIIAHSIKKNMENRRNLKTNNKYEEINYHMSSSCNLFHGFLVEGKPYVSNLFPKRASKVDFFWPVGDRRLTKSWGPEWAEWKNNLYLVDFPTNSYSPLRPDMLHGVDEKYEPNKTEHVWDSRLQIMANASDTYDDDININDIMISASRPSVFDEEVYM
jgi:hypothetical protein